MLKHRLHYQKIVGRLLLKLNVIIDDRKCSIKKWFYLGDLNSSRRSIIFMKVTFMADGTMTLSHVNYERLLKTL